MKVLLVADEYFSWGVYGGFGAFTRKLGRELVKRDVEVEAVVHKISEDQKPVGESEMIDGVKVNTLPRNPMVKTFKKKLYKTDADVIHSQCGPYDTYLVFQQNSSAKKIVTIQDLRTKDELTKIGVQKSFLRRIWASYVKQAFSQAIKMSDVLTCQAKLLIPKIHETFKTEKPIRFLPNFIDIPKANIKKLDDPSVVWLGRLDEIKRPELCFELAGKTPYIQYYILGKAHDKDRDLMLRLKYRSISNLHFLGFQTGKTKQETLSKAWILINTSIYECLPVSFLEALSYKCALLSTQNPDDYTSDFGAYASPTVDSLKRHLKWLLRDDRWRTLGEEGFEHVQKVHSTEKGVKTHMKIYEELLA